MRLTLEKYVPVDEGNPAAGSNLLDPKTWDRLRLDAGDDTFAIPPDREAWIDACEANEAYAARARALATLLSDANVERAISVGVGSATLEYHLVDCVPELNLIISDYSPRSIGRLRTITREFKDVVELDILGDAIAQFADRCFIIHRVDTDLTDEEWESVFRDLYRAGVERVLFVASGVLTPRIALRTLFHNIRMRLPGSEYAFAGYVRTRARIESFWEGRYRIARETETAGAQTYLLEIADG